MKTADQYLREDLGNLMVQNALLRAEVDQLREALARAERALETARVAAEER